MIERNGRWSIVAVRYEYGYCDNAGCADVRSLTGALAPRLFAPTLAVVSAATVVAELAAESIRLPVGPFTILSSPLAPPPPGRCPVISVSSTTLGVMCRCAPPSIPCNRTYGL